MQMRGESAPLHHAMRLYQNCWQPKQKKAQDGEWMFVARAICSSIFWKKNQKQYLKVSKKLKISRRRQ
jgi:alkylated DNA repair dioxygenase AlkB